jgi:hypothetical protein
MVAAPKEKKPENNQPEIEPSRPTAEKAEPKIDTKILELEKKLEQVRNTKEQEAQAILTEIKEVEQSRQEKYKFQKTPRQPSAELEPASALNVNQINAAALLGVAPNVAVQSLVNLATQNIDGFDRAVKILKEIAAHPGGAWIVDQFHAVMTQGKP